MILAVLSKVVAIGILLASIHVTWFSPKYVGAKRERETIFLNNLFSVRDFYTLFVLWLFGEFDKTRARLLQM